MSDPGRETDDEHIPPENRSTTTGDTLTEVVHLDLQPQFTENVSEHYGSKREALTCGECGARAEWFVSEIFDVLEGLDDLSTGRENQLRCDDCINNGLTDLWARWPWTPNDRLQIED